MKIQERSFAGKTFRPKPTCYISSHKKLITVVTPWGQEAIKPSAIFESLETQYNFFSGDKESTHPFPKKLSLTPVENDMRTALIQTNEKIFNDINQDEYSMGFELLFATLTKNILSFIQIGKPFILIDSKESFLQSIGHTMVASLSTPLKNKAESPPLPYHLLGIHEDISFSTFFFRLQPKDRLILLNRDTIPKSWFKLKREERDLNRLSQIAGEEKPHTPFWLAILEPFSD